MEYSRSITLTLLQGKTNSVKFSQLSTSSAGIQSAMLQLQKISHSTSRSAAPPSHASSFAHASHNSKQFFEYNETPLFLQLSKAAVTKDLPVTIYESVMEIIDNEAEVVLVQASYEIETGEAERVAVDHASKSNTSSTGSQSSLIASLTTQRNAIKMLFDRVSVIVQYLNAVAAGTAVKDQETLRQISALISSLPATDSEDFRDEFMTEHNDILLTTYLSTLTKQLNSANEVRHLSNQHHISLHKKLT
ncbi:hypothetical protein P7C70_g6393, partial [Phenoliferia sp. Uapishka_3]